MKRDEVAAAFAKRDFLLSNVQEVDGPLETKCLEWQRTFQNDKGYGYAIYKRRTYRTHRLFYILYNGPIPEDLRVCHHCDNPPCCNPEHLFLGTDHDNVLDCMTKGRRVVQWGVVGSRAALTDAQVANIKGLLLLDPWPSRQLSRLAERYGVSSSTIWKIKHGLRYCWVEPNLDAKMPPSREPPVKRRKIRDWTTPTITEMVAS
jgi:hypothetical protein